MFKKVFYSIGVVIVITICVIVTSSSNSLRVAQPGRTDVSGAPASTTPPTAASSPTPVLSTSTIKALNTDADVQTQPQYGVRTKTSNCAASQTLPDPACSPGAVLTTDTSVICTSGYTQTVRDVPTSEKDQVFAEYGIDWSQRSGYEVDHIISLELGGSNDISNLFPESYSIQYGARIKDKLENYLHQQVCSGKLPITLAQQEIATDWLTYYGAWQNSTASVPSTSVSAQNSASVSNAPAASSGAAYYYTSSYGTAKYYYPASCSAWKSLSSSYLAPFSSLDALLTKYPSRTLSPQCQ
jgi:hypothetical protein